MLAAAGAVRSFDPGAVLCRHGQAPVEVFVVFSGRVEVTQDDPAGNRTVLDRRGRGDVLGEMSALDGAPASATVIALEATAALAIPAPRFNALCGSRPRIGMTVASIVAARLRSSDERRVEGRRDVLQRTILVLVRLAEASPATDRRGVDLTVTQRELADMVPAAPVSVARALDDLRRAGVLRTGRGHIHVEDLQKLRRMALSE